MARIYPNRYYGATNPIQSLAGLQVWHDMSQSNPYILNVNGTNVSQVTDFSGNAYHATQATQANQPTLTTNAINGHNAVLFGAGSIGMAYSGSALSMLNGAAGCTLTIVMNTTIVPTGSTTLVPFCAAYHSGANARFAPGRYQTRDICNLLTTDTTSPSYQAQTGGSIYTANTWYIYSYVWDNVGQTLTIYQNGTQKGQLTSVGTSGQSFPATNSNTINLGCYSSLTSSLQGNIAGMTLYSRTLNSTDRGTVENYFNAEFAVH